MSKTVFIDADKSQGRPGTLVRASWLNWVFGHRHDGLDKDGSSPIDYAEDTGAANAYVIALTPALDAYISGLPIWFKAVNANTGAATININGRGAKPINKFGTQALAAEEIRSGQMVCVVYDGTNFQLLSRGQAQQADAAVNYAVDAGVADAYAANLAPALSEYITGAPVLFLAANTNTGAATLNINGLGAVVIKKRGNLALDAGDIVAGQVAVAIYDGTSFQLLTPAFSNGVPVGSILYNLSRRTPAGYLPFRAATLLRAVYAELFAYLVPQFTVTLPVGTPLTIPKVAHGLYSGDRVRFVTTGTLPTGVVVGQDYYVLTAGLTDSAFEISTAPGGAPVAVSGVQDGVHTLFCWSVCGPGNGLTTFELPDPRGYFLRIWDGGRGVDPNRVFGSMQDDMIKAHAHSEKAFTGQATGVGYGDNGYHKGVSGTQDTGSFGGIETRPFNMAVPAYIKY